MALYQVDIEKRLGSEYWTNRYIANMSSLAEAVILGGDIVDAERIIHSELVTFTKYRASVLVGEVYSITTVGEFGLRDQEALLPLFNTLRYDFPAASGRPSRKYYRGVLGESDISGDAVQATFAAFETAIEALFSTGGESQGIVDPQGELLNDAIRWPFVQMRQLRRGTRRRTLPIFQ